MILLRILLDISAFDTFDLKVLLTCLNTAWRRRILLFSSQALSTKGICSGKIPTIVNASSAEPVLVSIGALVQTKAYRILAFLPLSQLNRLFSWAKESDSGKVLPMEESTTGV